MSKNKGNSKTQTFPMRMKVELTAAASGLNLSAIERKDTENKPQRGERLIRTKKRT